MKSRERMTVPRFVKAKGEQKLVCLTAYDFTFAKLVDAAGVDLVLVGDSAGNVIDGFGTTLPVEMKEMVQRTAAVSRGTERALVVADMPFMSYQPSLKKGIKNAGRFMKAGAEGVKIEGGLEVAELVASLTSYGIPVMAHIGMLPQRVSSYGGFRLQKEGGGGATFVEEAKALEEAGAFSLVLEKVPAAAAKEVTGAVNIPTVGIGAGPDCDGQILVLYDMLGLDPSFSPKFLKRYVDGHAIFKKAIEQYGEDVRRGAYPTEDQSY